MSFRPIISSVHIDKALTDFSLECKESEFVAEKLFPIKNVKNISDKYFKYGEEMFYIQNTEVTPKSVASDFEYTVSTDQYSLGLHGLGGFVSQEQIDNSDLPLDAEKDMTRFLTRSILRAREYIAAVIAKNTSNYKSGMAESLSGINQWSDYTSSNPIKKVMEMREAIQKEIGVYPNVMIIGSDVYNVLKSHPVIRDVVKYSKFGMPTKDDFAQMFEVEQVIEAGSIYKTSSASSHIWGGSVILARVENLGIMSSTFGVTFQKSDGRKVIVETYLHPAGKRIVVEDKFIPSIVSNNAGYLLNNVIS